ncbi:C-terminal binding protein [Paenibacillus sp. MZ04-78.2]|uniref:C-terminal binding protein n=1 Tax=Paenibacillus sp. MZ04-78.2 TaxID=2962034 RepID=UPI0020B7029A|nr:C-terminal binding protein [Paenibacillus sp. MZ04-78.2]MCP3775771.1 C-terminal binding protein [Paenibacillus sp. MZ04-78.2]
MNAYQVAVTDYGFPDLKQEKAILEPLGFHFVTGQCKTAAEVAALCQDADAVLTQWAPVTAEAIEAFRKCQIIVRYGIGVDNVDLEAAKRKNIPVVNVPDYAVHEVADHTLSLMLGIVRKIPQIVQRVRSGVWEIAPCRPIIGLQDKIIGVAGFGNIAKAVVRRAQAFGLTAIGYDPFVSESVFAGLGVEKVDWQTLLTRSDIISVHMPLTKETRHIFNEEAFRGMKQTSFLVNTSRGGTIDTAALISALQSDEIAGAALDVLEHEPIPPDSPLLQMEQCIVTSHCAWYSENALLRLQEYAALEIKRLFSGETPQHIMNGVGK